MNIHIHPCHPETTEIITNAEHAYQDGEITREQRNEIIMQCIELETNEQMLKHYQEVVT